MFCQTVGGGDNLAISPSVNLIGVFGNLQIIGDLCCGVVRGGVGAAKCPMTYVM
jgi:hypothetical protein